nr:nucleotidyltransferase family protein [uncultured Brevundimonas sp.]
MALVKSQMVRIYKQSCVHLWFQDRFGEPYPPLASTDEALGRFVAPTFAVGVRLEADDTLTVAAPFGLEDVFCMTIRPNPNRPLAKSWTKVIENARARWPELTVVEA